MSLPPNITNVAEFVAYMTARDQSRETRLAALEGGTVTPTPTPGPTPAPSITSPAAISSDGTPQVGELLTGVDPVVAYGSVTARRWLLGTTTLTTNKTYTPTATGDHRYVTDITGDDGSALQNSATITVAAATVTPTPTPTPITIALAGSSSPYRYVNDFAGTVNPNVTVSSDGINYTTLTAGRFGMDLGNALNAATGRPVRFISGGIQGTTLATWAGDTYVDRQRLTTAMKAAGTVDFVLVQVGFNDVNQGTNTITYADQLARYRKLITLLRSESGFTNLKAILNPSQDSPSYPAQMALQRMAEMTVVNNDANVLIGFNGFDLATFDNIHQTTASAGVAAQRFYPQAMAVLTGSAQKRGPAVLSTTPISQTQTRITIKHGAGTDFTPTSGISGFSVFDSGGAALAISAAVRESATTILLTHASTGGNAASVYYSPDAGASDDTTQVHDNSALALPMEASAQTLAIAASGGTVTPLSVSGTPGPATVGQSYSYAPTAAGGSGTKTWSTSGTALPAGLSINSTTGLVSGTPTAAGTVSGIIITVTDTSGSASQTVSIAVAAAAAVSRTAKVAFGRETTNIPASFNNFLAGTSQVQNNNLGISLNLNDTSGSATGWKITTTSAFNAAQDNNGITTTGDTGVYPNSVSIRNWYNGNANAGDNGGVSTPTTTMDITGLNPAKTYAFKVAAFRGAADRKVIVTIGTTSVTFDAGSNSADGNVGNIAAMAPDSTGKLTLTFARATGYSFGYLSVLEIYEN